MLPTTGVDRIHCEIRDQEGSGENLKNFKNYEAPKYHSAAYKKAEDGIYQIGDTYVTTLSFEQEKDRFGEESGSPKMISQVPLEDLLDKYFVYISDFYEKENEQSQITCYQEFASADVEDLRKLRTVIGKSFYAVEDKKSATYQIVIE